MTSLMFFVVIISCIGSISAFYLPGLAPVNYCAAKVASDTCPVKYNFSLTSGNNEILNYQHFSHFQNNIPVFVNRLNSEEAIIPFEYHQ